MVQEIMTPESFRAGRNLLGHTQRSLAAEWGMGKNGGRTIRRWETGDLPVNPIAAYALRMMIAEAI